MSYQKIREEALSEWNELINSRKPRIVVGTATCGVAVGAEEVIASMEREIQEKNLQVDIIRVGCLGVCYTEPLVIIFKEGNPPIAYGKITPENAGKLISTYFIEDDPCFDLALGTLELREDGRAYIPEIERMDKEERVVLKLSGLIDPENINHYIAFNGYQALNMALHMRRDFLIKEIKDSRLRGLGGAGFPTAIKMEATYKAQDKERFIICNADEGDPGAFMDRVVLESCPHQVIEGMVISAYIVGSKKGYVYTRMEYPLAIARLKKALAQAREKGFLGKNILGSGFDFDLEVIPGAGAFVCGESSALTASIEGRRPMPRVRPPRSTEVGLFGKPTLINNVKTFACIPAIVNNGAKWFASLGTEKSKGTAVFSLAGKVEKPGLVEVVMGTTLREVIYTFGGGVKGGKNLKGVQIGGPSGGCIPAKFIDTPIDFDSLKSLGSMMGSGGLIVLDDDTCMVDIAKYFLFFLKDESCGKCSFCRVGLSQMFYILENISRGEAKPEDIESLYSLAEDVKEGSLCSLGKTAANPILTTIKYFKEEYQAHVIEKICPALVCRDLMYYYIIPEKCYRGCEHCVLKCPVKAISTNEKGWKVVDQEKCTKCGNCLEVCPIEYGAVVKKPGKNPIN
ncbi:MAG: NADP-reducing hydrogenase subunit HndC [candidate division WS2 bacterium]|nr:NADP-reducing hydrogenase subunit HndC [Candidatus Psychracetigena formicireducens]